MPFQRMRDTVLADALYRSCGCVLPFQWMPDPVRADAVSTGQTGREAAPILGISRVAIPS